MLAFRDGRPGSPGIRQRRNRPTVTGRLRRVGRRGRNGPGRDLVAPPGHPRGAPPQRRNLARTARHAPRREPDRRPPAASLARRRRRSSTAGPFATVSAGRATCTTSRPTPRSLFPSNYDGLAAGLLAAIGMVGGDALVDEVFDARRRLIAQQVEGPPRRAVARRRVARGPRPRARGHPGRAGLPVERGDRRRRDDPAPAVQLRDLRGRQRVDVAVRGGARPVRARSSAPTWSASRTSRRATGAARTGSRRRPRPDCPPGRARLAATPLRAPRPRAARAAAGSPRRPRRSARTTPRATSRPRPPGPRR